jgi:cyclopropane-fatty-acyl-phospholipid synthase
MQVLEGLLKRFIATGELTVQIGARRFTVGAAPPDKPWLVSAIRIKDNATALKLALDPDFQLGQCYMDGDLTITCGTLWTFMELIGHNMPHRGAPGLAMRARGALARIVRAGNDRRRARRNVQRHYDLSETLYRQFLDADMQYSCAYFAHADDSLDTAQTAKKAHIAAKLALESGQRVLDIGCGWGGMALSLAQACDVHVTGITLSEEQLRVAQARAEAAGLSDRVRFELRDYRDIAARFDRVVSVGMFEHVGREHFDTYFAAVRDLLTDDGVALVHAIGRKDPGSGSNPWMDRYIFPGGYIPALSETMGAIERSGLWATDIEILRLHYADTLLHWRRRCEANRQIIELLYDARFYRMWEFYLACCEMAFRYDGMMVNQIQLTRSIDALPRTRGYMAQGESVLAHRFAEDHTMPVPADRVVRIKFNQGE